MNEPDGMMQQLFTIVCDYAGGTYVSQVRADGVGEALVNWGALLRRDGPIPEVSIALADEAEHFDSDPTPIDGLTGVWCWTALARDKLALVNLIRSS